MKTTIKITDLTHEDLTNFLSTALYGSFWAGADYDESDEEGITMESEFDGSSFEDILASLLLNGKTITITDEEEEKDYKINLEMIIKGFNKVGKSEDYRHHVWNFITEDYDYNDADIILQFIIFGEEMYA